MRIKLRRDVLIKECWWLNEDLKKGQEFYLYSGTTYGSCGSGVVVTKEDGKTPFFEIPFDSYEDFPEDWEDCPECKGWGHYGADEDDASGKPCENCAGDGGFLIDD